MYHSLYGCAIGFFDYISLDLEDIPSWWDESLEGMPHFLDYAKAWIDFGKGARECGNDFSVFVASLMVATDLWKSGELRFEYRRNNPNGPIRVPTSILDKDCRSCIAVLDPTYFSLVVANPGRMHEAIAEMERHRSES